MADTVNFSLFKARCSAISKIMSNSAQNPVLTEKQAERMAELEDKESLTDKQKEELAQLIQKKKNGETFIPSASCLEYLMEAYAWETERMIPVDKESMDVMQIKKGKMAEETARLLLCELDQVEYRVHKERVSNDYLTGEIDFYYGESVFKAKKISDIKNSFDYPSFLKKIGASLDPAWKLQVQGYGDILNPESLEIAHCLVSMPEEIQNDVKWQVARKMNAISIESPEFVKEFEKFSRSMNFGHMPLRKRVKKVTVEPFTKEYQLRLYDRIKHCRDWLNEFHEIYTSMN